MSKNINILKGLPGCKDAKGVAVIIDVFRATSTIVCLTISKPKSLIVAGTVDQISGGANSVLFSEKSELNPQYDNSPLGALGGKFEDKFITIHSKNGTAAINALRHCDTVIIGSFLNADAVVSYLHNINVQDISIIPIGHIGVPEETEEDNACADYIRDSLIGTTVNIEEYRSRLRDRIIIRRSDPLSPQGNEIEEDLALCSMMSVFNVVPRAVFHEDGAIEIVAESIQDPYSLKGKELFCFRTVKSDILTVEQIAEIGRALCESNDLMKNGVLDRELAEYCADLILLSKESIQKAVSYVSAFFNAVTEKRKLEWKKEAFMRLVLECLLTLQYESSRNQNLTDEERVELIKRIVHTFRNCPKNITAFIAKILGTGSSNYGRLYGRIVPTTQIIYHKRDTGEFSINITNKCGNSCTFCIRDFCTGWRDSKEPQNLYLEREPTKEEVLEAVRVELAKWPEGCLVKICGYGEPVERIDVVFDIVHLIKTTSPACVVQLDTSGWPLLELCDEKVFETLKIQGLDNISVSLNAPNKNLYDRIVRPGCFECKESAYENTLKCIRLAKDHGFHVKATFVLTKVIKQHEEACKKLVEQLGVEYVGREYVGRASGEDPHYEPTIDTEVKVLDINREEIILALKEAGALHETTGITKMYHYEIPDDRSEQEEIMRIIRSNMPELRRIYPISKILKKCIEEKKKLIDRLGLLRIIVEKDMTRLEYQESVDIRASSKKEQEFKMKMKDQEDAMMYVNTIGLHLFRFMERNRERYVLDRTYFNVDTWPKLGTYLEVGSFDEIEVFRGLLKIGISPSKASGVHAEDLFKAKGISLEHLTFSDAELKNLGFSRDDLK